MNDDITFVLKVDLPEHYEEHCDVDVLFRRQRIASLRRLRLWCAPMERVRARHHPQWDHRRKHLHRFHHRPCLFCAFLVGWMHIA